MCIIQVFPAVFEVTIKLLKRKKIGKVMKTNYKIKLAKTDWLRTIEFH